MKLKKTLGAAFTVLGIIGLIYTGFELMKRSTTDTLLVIIAALGLFLFTSGIVCLVKRKKVSVK